ncbi:MAG TPA: sugar-binding protein, partial [Vicinamibacterales bacterium]|nr:sugar-binding protein [Vicinamibacterales bacterium]
AGCGAGAAGCSIGCPGPPPRTDAEAPRKMRFAIIPKALDIPVFNYAKVGAERAAREYGDVEVLWNAPASADQLKQKEILESYITQRVDGIAISSLNGEFLAETINRAIDAGIPVTTWDSDAPTSRRIAFYGVDDLASGRIMGEQAIAMLNGKGKVALITSLGAANLQNRLNGVKEALAKAPGIEVVETYDIKEDVIRCAEIIATGSRRYPDLAAWISVGGWPVFTRNALASVDPSKTKVISFDTISPALDLLREGKVQVLLGQKYFGWGSESVKLLRDIKQGKNPPAPIIDSGVDVGTRENVEAYEQQWKRMAQQ